MRLHYFTPQQSNETLFIVTLNSTPRVHNTGSHLRNICLAQGQQSNKTLYNNSFADVYKDYVTLFGVLCIFVFYI